MKRISFAGLLFRSALLALSPCAVALLLFTPSVHAQTQCIPWHATLINGNAALAGGQGDTQMAAANAAVADFNRRSNANLWPEPPCAGLPHSQVENPTVTDLQWGTFDLYTTFPWRIGPNDICQTHILFARWPIEFSKVCDVPPAPPPPPPPPPPEEEGGSCSAGSSAGHPIIPATGEKVLHEVDYAGDGADPLSMVRSFRSSRVVGAASGAATAGLGAAWSHNHSVVLQLNGAAATSGSTAQVVMGNGTTRNFTWDTVTGRWKPTNSADTLVAANGRTSYRRSDDDSTAEFDLSGKLLTHTRRNGWVLRYAYDAAGKLASVSNQFARTLRLTYNAQNQLSAVTAPDGQVFGYQYDGASRLSGVSEPGGVTRRYLYENVAYPQLLTGIVDESGNRLATYTYDSMGRGVATEYAGGADRYSISYGGTNTAVVTDPLGTPRTYGYSTTFGKLVVSGADKPSEFSRGDAASRVQDANGFTTLETDFLGVNRMFTWDVNRRLPLSVTQAAARLEAQTTSTQWHPGFALPVLVNEAGRTKAFSYDALGNKLSETVTATVGGQSRTTRWSYTSQGLVETMTDAKGGVWRYAYDAGGNRTSMTNALGQQTAYAYDTSDRVTRLTEPNGLVTTFSYDARGRLIGQVRGSDATLYTYTPAGLIASATLPNGYQVTYSYDAAQRLVAAVNNRGAHVQYTLDAMGNRIREEVRDAGGAIALVTGRVINALNKVVALQGASGQTTALAYDANGEPVAQTDPLNQTTRRSLDGLRRPVSTTFADSASATQAWSELDQLSRFVDAKGVVTTYQSNAFDEVISEASPDTGNVTYQRNENGELAAIADPVGNNTSIERDGLGRPTRIQYASDQVTAFSYDQGHVGYVSKIDTNAGLITYSRDGEGRITTKVEAVNDTPASPSQYKVQYGYTGGELSSIVYPSGLKVVYRRSAGRVTAVDVQEPSSNPLKSKPVVPFLGNLAHTALGQPRSWTWSSGDSASRSFDADGRMTSSEVATYGYDAASRITSITQSLWAAQHATQAHGSNKNNSTTAALYTVPLRWTAAYDSRNRLTRMARDGAESTYSYDANSNRLTAIDKVTSAGDMDDLFDGDDFTQTSRQDLKVDASSNKLLGFTQTISRTREGSPRGATTAVINYTLDANGAMTGDGRRAFEYDASRRLSKVKLLKDGETASVRYLHNALGQRVFKGEIVGDGTQPDQDKLGLPFVEWLKQNFQWMFTAQANTSVGTAFIYDEDTNLLGEYDNGSAAGKGRQEYIWLPGETGRAMPIGIYRNGKLFAVHADHLGTPRLITDETNRPVWQWPYSAFGNNKPTGILKATPNTNTNTDAATPNPPMLLKATDTEIGSNLRFPGQYFDEESNLSYNYFRSL